MRREETTFTEQAVVITKLELIRELARASAEVQNDVDPDDEHGLSEILVLVVGAVTSALVNNLFEGNNEKKENE